LCDAKYHLHSLLFYAALSLFAALFTTDDSLAIVLAVFCGICLAFSLIIGCCILGLRQHTQRSYLSLRTTPRLRICLVGIVPFVIIVLFFTLACMTLSDASLATGYIRSHSDGIYTSASLKPSEDPQKIHGVTYDQFLTYMSELPQFVHLKEDVSFTERVKRIFDSMCDGKLYLTRDDVFGGMLASLSPLRTEFGVSALFVFLINLFFLVAFLGSYYQLQSVQLEKQIEALKVQKALYAAQQAAAAAAVSSSQALLEAGAQEQAWMLDYADDDYDDLLLDGNGDDGGLGGLGLDGDNGFGGGPGAVNGGASGVELMGRGIGGGNYGPSDA